MSSEHSPTPTPWKWHQCGKEWVLWGDHGHRPIVLDGKNLRVRNQEHCVMVPFDPNHPDAALIVQAVNHHEKLVEALKKLTEALPSEHHNWQCYQEALWLLASLERKEG